MMGAAASITGASLVTWRLITSGPEVEGDAALLSLLLLTLAGVLVVMVNAFQSGLNVPPGDEENSHHKGP